MREVLSRGFQSKSLAIVYAVNIYSTGYLFPTEIIFPGVDSHTWDLMVGVGGATSILLTRSFFRSRTNNLYTWEQISFSFCLVVFAATAVGIAGSVLLFSSNIPQSSILGVFVFSPLSTLGQILIFSLIIGALIYSSQTSKGLAQERIALNLIRKKLREEFDSHKAALTLQILDTLKPSLKSIEEQVAVGARNSEIVSQINMAINEVIRPLSHALDEQNSDFNLHEVDKLKLARRIRRVPLRNRLTRIAPLNLVINPIIAFANYFCFILLSLLYIFTWSEALLVFLPFLTFSYLFFKMLGKLIALVEVKVFMLLLGSILVSIVQSFSFFLLGINRGLDPQPIGTIAFSVFTLTLGSSIFQLVVSGIKHNLGNAEDVNLQIAQSISTARKELWRFRKILSRELHGGLQAKLQVLALQIEKGLEVSSASLSEVQKSLYSVVESEQDAHVPIIEFLKEQKEFWEGVCEINFEISSATYEKVDSNVVINECIREVIRESINNAIKHAKASRMSIKLRLSNESFVHLSVLNPTNHLVTTVTGSNFGSKLFEELTDSWSMDYNSDSTQFRASFKMKDPIQKFIIEG